MKGMSFLGAKQFKICDIQDRKLSNREVLIKVMACGVCGTDVHIYHGSKGSADVNPPVILGHEISGVVEKIGSKVTLVQKGDHVTIDPNIYCGGCHFCRIGKKQLCSNLFAIGVNRDGGFADYCYVPEGQCYKLEDRIPFEVGAMAEPLACCIHGIDRLNIQVGSSVLVIGGGAIGLMMVQLAKLAGASTVILSEPVSKRREIGISLGADIAIDPRNEPIEETLEAILGTMGVDYIIECVGNLVATDQAFKAAKRGASILLFSVPKAGSLFQLPLEDVFQKELIIIGSMINPDTHLRAVNLINSGNIRVVDFITHVYPIEQLEDAILMQMSNESIKVIVGKKV